jgi:hypothetical protein
VRFHNRALPHPLVVYATKVEYAVYYHAVQFRPIVASQPFGIASYSIQRNEHIAGNSVQPAVVEGYDVGEIIVLEILAVDFNNFFIVAKDIRYIAHRFSEIPGNRVNPAAYQTFVDGRHRHPIRNKRQFSHFLSLFPCKDSAS